MKLRLKFTSVSLGFDFFFLLLFKFKTELTSEALRVTIKFALSVTPRGYTHCKKQKRKTQPPKFATDALEKTKVITKQGKIVQHRPPCFHTTKSLLPNSTGIELAVFSGHLPGKARKTFPSSVSSVAITAVPVRSFVAIQTVYEIFICLKAMFVQDHEHMLNNTAIAIRTFGVVLKLVLMTLQ